MRKQLFTKTTPTRQGSLFEKIGLDKDYTYIGLIEEVELEKWDIIEE